MGSRRSDDQRRPSASPTVVDAMVPGASSDQLIAAIVADHKFANSQNGKQNPQ